MRQVVLPAGDSPPPTFTQWVELDDGVAVQLTLTLEPPRAHMVLAEHYQELSDSGRTGDLNLQVLEQAGLTPQQATRAHQKAHLQVFHLLTNTAHQLVVMSDEPGEPSITQTFPLSADLSGVLTLVQRSPNHHREEAHRWGLYLEDVAKDQLALDPNTGLEIGLTWRTWRKAHQVLETRAMGGAPYARDPVFTLQGGFSSASGGRAITPQPAAGAGTSSSSGLPPAPFKAPPPQAPLALTGPPSATEFTLGAMILPSHEVEDFRLLEAESRTPAYLPGGPYFPLTFGNFWGRDNVGLNQVHIIFDIGGTLHVKDDQRRLPESFDHYQPGIREP